MKKLKKAWGKGAEGIVNITTSAAKTIVNAPLSDAEKHTLRTFRGTDASTSLVEQVAVISQIDPQISHIKFDEDALPNYDVAMMGMPAYQEDF